MPRKGYGGKAAGISDSFRLKHARVPARKGGHKARTMVSASSSIKRGNRIRRNKLNLPAGEILQFSDRRCDAIFPSQVQGKLS